MDKKVMSLKKKVILTQSGLALIIIAVMTTVIYLKALNLMHETAMRESWNLAGKNAKTIEAVFNAAVDKAIALNSAFKSAQKTGASRDFISSILKHKLEDSPDVLGVWTCWEPDAYDGNDSNFINKENHDSTGRVAYYWSRANGVKRSALADYENSGSFYDIPRKTGKMFITDPYYYDIGGTKYYMVTVSVPLKLNGRVVAVSGFDFTIEAITELVNSIKPYETGYAFLTTNNGTVVAHKRAEVIGKKQQDLKREQENLIKNGIGEGKDITYDGSSKTNGELSKYFQVPVKYGQTDKPWSFGISVPVDKVMEGPRALRNYSILIGFIGIAIIALITTYLAGQAFDPIIRMKDMMQEAAEGEADMTRRLPVGAMDEQGELAYWFNIFIERIQHLIKDVKENAATVSSAALQISSSTEELAATVEEQSSQAQSVSSALTQLSATSADIAGSMEEARNISENSSNMTQEGSKTIQESIDSLEQIDSQAGNLSRIVGELGDSTSKIGAIIEVINDVADQTNLLALNAAIEAARAGEHGRGFAVVADEVRKLAERTGKATNEIVAIIDSLQQKSSEADKAMTETTSEVNNGRELGQSSLEILGKIVESGDEVQQAATSVATAIEQENATIDEISGSLQEIAAGTEESATAVQEVTQTADDLAKEAEKLRELVEQFVTE